MRSGKYSVQRNDGKETIKNLLCAFPRPTLRIDKLDKNGLRPFLLSHCALGLSIG